jgi:hypothetical protein
MGKPYSFLRLKEGVVAPLPASILTATCCPTTLATGHGALAVSWPNSQAGSQPWQL